MSAHNDPIHIKREQFPEDFLWGCSTSSYQIEGAANEDGRGPSIWDEFSAQPGRILDGSSGAIACDHYHRWPEDLDLARDLGVKAYRFSVSWPRIFPVGTGEIEERGLEFYDRLVDGIIERGMEPWLTLYHWDLPQALQLQGGWKSRATVDAFNNYADVVSRRLGDRVKHWITHNEPWCSCIMGYYEGVHAPGETSLQSALQACHHVLLSHGQATKIIRTNVPGAQIGITLSLHPIIPASDNAADLAAKVRHDGMRNRWFLDPLYGRGYPQDTVSLMGELCPQVFDNDMEDIAMPTDFLGVNYYFPEVVKDAPGTYPFNVEIVETPNVERTAFGWQVAPEKMTELLLRIQADYAPANIYLTENGSTYDDVFNAAGEIIDEQRKRYLARHLVAALDSVKAGVNLNGYFVWSLLDNFEWAQGYLRRFGLTYIDYQTQRRILKESGKWFARFLKSEHQR
ncbi:GH1 family beta-glucosidase [Undibacterium sp. SXout20W]|uniref:GH1 family beta-glucosidase n=1 Tax=Undibacterium sp. SXout20W TaxID=3413051 RepID=UPI003BF2DA10